MAMPCSKDVLEPRVQGTVKWYNVKNGYGFITRDDTKNDIFVHRTSIITQNEIRSVGDGERVQFDVAMGERGLEAINVTGPNGQPVKGSPFAVKRMRLRLRMRQRDRNANNLSVSLTESKWKTYRISSSSEILTEPWYGTRTFSRRVNTPNKSSYSLTDIKSTQQLNPVVYKQY